MLHRDSPLFTPFKIGPLEVSNRFIASAISFRDADQYGFPSKSEQDHIKRLARGQVGLIITGFMYSEKDARVDLWQDGFSSTCHADAWREIVDVVHSYGSKIIIQIAHSGVSRSRTFGGISPQMPKAVSSLFNGATQALSIAEIATLVKSFGRSAKLMQSVGVDGIELQCGYGFMLSQFLSPLTNRRHDIYGGSVQNRARIITDIIKEIKHNTDSSKFSIFAKINGSDQVKGGVTPAIAKQTISILANEGVNLFEISHGLVYPWRNAKSKKNQITQKIPRLYNEFIEKNKTSDFGNPIKKEIIFDFKKTNPGVAFAMNGNLRNFQDMENLIKDGTCDMVSLGRPLLKEPFLVQKFYGSTEESDCDNCNQCLMNPPYLTLHCHKSFPLPID